MADKKETKFQLYIGYFEGENFRWKMDSSYPSFSAGYAAFKSLGSKLVSMKLEDLISKYNSGRVDVELKKDDKTIDWMGVNIQTTKEEEL